MSDNHWSYVRNRSLRELFAAHAIRHLLIEPRRPQTNGKVERYQQTLKREWGLGQRYRSSEHRARRCHTGCTTTTSGGATQRSATTHPSAAFGTSRGRTASWA